MKLHYSISWLTLSIEINVRNETPYLTDYVENNLCDGLSHDRQRSFGGTAFQSGRFNAGDQFLSENDKLIKPCRGMAKAKKST